MSWYVCVIVCMRGERILFITVKGMFSFIILYSRVEIQLYKSREIIKRVIPRARFARFWFCNNCDSVA